MSNLELIKHIVKGTADLKYVLAGGIVVYELVADDGSKYQLEIDLTDKHDVGDTSSFSPHYGNDSSSGSTILLMRWIRRAVENETLVKIK